jgi:hypothetical protein
MAASCVGRNVRQTAGEKAVTLSRRQFAGWSVRANFVGVQSFRGSKLPVARAVQPLEIPRHALSEKNVGVPTFKVILDIFTDR